jgi:hypothetical protein
VVTGPTETPKPANDNLPRREVPPDNNPRSNTWGRYLSRQLARLVTRTAPRAAGGLAGAALVTQGEASLEALKLAGIAGRANLDAYPATPLTQPVELPSLRTPLLGIPFRPQLSLAAPSPAPESSPETNVRVLDPATREKKMKGAELIQRGNFSPATDAAKRPPALWSGGPPAMNAAHAAGHSTMESTTGGQELQQYVKDSGLEWENSRQLWKRASAKYASEVARQAGPGSDIPAFVRGNNPNSILNGVEEKIINRMGSRVVRFPVP